MNYKIIIFLIFSCSTLSSCGQDNELKKVEIKYPNGQIKIEGTTLNGKKHGPSNTYYENGQIQTKNNWENNVQIGQTLKWFENGNKELEGQLENGNETGEWKYFDPLDEAFIYSVLYKNGEVVDYRFEGEKYRWRVLNLKNLDFTIEIPTYLMDSAQDKDGFTAYWAIYPWINKNDIEFYSIIKTNFPIEKEDLKLKIEGLSKGKLDILKLLFNNTSDNSSTPNINYDRYEILENKATNIQGHDAFQLSIKFTELNVEFKSIIIPFKDNVQIISAYFNQKVEQRNRDMYFNSIKIR